MMMRPWTVTLEGLIHPTDVTDNLNDSILNLTNLGFRRSRLRLNGKILAPMAGRVVAIIKSEHLLGFETQSGKVYWWQLGLIWPTCPVVPFELMVKVGDDLRVGQPIAVMVNAWWQPHIVVSAIKKRFSEILILLRATTNSRPVTVDEPVLTHTVLSLAGNHQVRTIGPPC